MLIRVDDYPFDKFYDKYQIRDRENLWFEFIHQLNLPCCVGVIPSTCNLIEIDQLKRSDVEVEIAAHGLYHKRNEFDGDDCHNKIALMKQIMEQNNINCTNFIPPFNKLTEKMCCSLSDLNFKIVQGHPDFKINSKYKFKYMPFTWYGLAKDFLDFDFSKNSMYDILTLHLPWEEQYFDQKYLCKLRDRIQQYVIPWSRVI